MEWSLSTIPCPSDEKQLCFPSYCCCVQSDTGRYTITNDTYMLDLSNFEWSRITADNAPSARAAHAAACVDSMQFVVYGGATGGGSLSTDEVRRKGEYGLL